MLIAISFILCSNIFGQGYTVDTRTFKPPPEKNILLLSKPDQARKLILFYSNLRVNTDGSPRSYHPDDFHGQSLAINSLCNGIGVYRVNAAGKRIRTIKTCTEKKRVFDLFKAKNYVNPKGYQVVWRNVIAERNKKPCIFQDGDVKGYFGSLTSEKNGLTSANSGECGYKNQLDAVTIPHLVLPARTWKDAKGTAHINPLHHPFGAGSGDFVFAYNPENMTWSYAVLGDAGPGNNLGEGSVALNMKLKKSSTVPTNYQLAKKLDTGTAKIFVAIIPNSRSNLVKPYTAEKIEKRGRELIIEMGFRDEQAFIAFLLEQKSRF